MARNSVANMVIEASDVGGAAGGTGGVAGRSIEVASGIDGVAGAGDTHYVGCSSRCVCSVCAGTGDAGLGGAGTCAE